MDDILEIINKWQADNLTQHPTQVDATESIKCTDKEEQEINTLINKLRKEEVAIELLVYR